MLVAVVAMHVQRFKHDNKFAMVIFDENFDWQSCMNYAISLDTCINYTCVLHICMLTDWLTFYLIPQWGPLIRHTSDIWIIEREFHFTFLTYLLKCYNLIINVQFRRLSAHGVLRYCHREPKQGTPSLAWSRSACLSNKLFLKSLKYSRYSWPLKMAFMGAKMLAFPSFCSKYRFLVVVRILAMRRF